jgi:hypothetical protein
MFAVIMIASLLCEGEKGLCKLKQRRIVAYLSLYAFAPLKLYPSIIAIGYQ